jgi:pyruvate/2-oxoglutarate dehydrogenase complex dihydrolipoamide acyltransferase (E2) component
VSIKSVRKYAIVRAGADHRVVDGARADEFPHAIVGFLEEPAGLAEYARKGGK